MGARGLRSPNTSLACTYYVEPTERLARAKASRADVGGGNMTFLLSRIEKAMHRQGCRAGNPHRVIDNSWKGTADQPVACQPDDRWLQHATPPWRSLNLTKG